MNKFRQIIHIYDHNEKDMSKISINKLQNQNDNENIQKIAMHFSKK
jgi:hypothetical protein